MPRHHDHEQSHYHPHHFYFRTKTGASKAKFAAPVFTRSFTTFDRQNPHAANSPFHGFFTLFWMAVFLFVVKIGASNWRTHGSPLGTNEIMRTMFGRGGDGGTGTREVLVLAVADGVMCAATGFGWALQRFGVRGGWVDWDGAGWVMQNVSPLALFFSLLLPLRRE